LFLLYIFVKKVLQLIPIFPFFFVNSSTKQSDFVHFYGLLYEEDVGFSTSAPLDLTPTLASSYDCLARSEEPGEFSFNSKLSNSWVLFTPNTKELSLSCQMSSCGQNQYLSGGTCEQCPENSLSDEGTTTVDDCEPCYPGFELAHPLGTSCSLSSEFDTSIDTSNGWRIMALSTEDETVEDSKLPIEYMEFRSSPDCDPGSKVDTASGTPFGSNDNGGGPENAFVDDGSKWSKSSNFYELLSFVVPLLRFFFHTYHYRSWERRRRH